MKGKGISWLCGRIKGGKFIKSLGKNIKRGREYHGCEEEYVTWKKGEGEAISS